MDNIFDADFFEDAIEDVDMYDEYEDDYEDAYEDVDMFDENYFEANEGNPINRGKKKEWEYDQSGANGSSDDKTINAFRRENQKKSLYHYSQYDNNHVGQSGWHRYDYPREQRLASNPGGRSKRDIQKDNAYWDRYTKAKANIDERNRRNAARTDRYNTAVPKKFQKQPERIESSHKNIVHEMNHPSKR